MNERGRLANELLAADEDLIHVATSFFPDLEAIEALPGRDDTVRVRQGGVWWRVHRWPEGTPMSRPEFVHQVLRGAAAAGISRVPVIPARPDGEAAMLWHGRLYDAQTWLPGWPVNETVEAQSQDGRWIDLPAVLPDPVFSDLVRTVAEIHDATQELVAASDAPSMSIPALVNRVRRAWTAHRSLLRPLAPRTPAVRRWLTIGQRAMPAAEAAIAATGARLTSQSVIHSEIWPSHVLIESPEDLVRISGLVGWEHCGTGSPLLDIVQTISRCRGWSATSAELAIAAYGDVQPLKPEERRLLPAIAALDLVGTCGQMLNLAYGGRPEGARPPGALREAARSLLDSLDVATSALTRIEQPKRPSSRRDRRPPGSRHSHEPPRRPRGPQKRR